MRYLKIVGVAVLFSAGLVGAARYLEARDETSVPVRLSGMVLTARAMAHPACSEGPRAAPVLAPARLPHPRFRAGAERLERSTAGFGDQCSTN